MSKSVLVIDTPNGCTNCPLFYYNAMGSNYECKGTSGYNRPIEIYGYQIKPDWCPLSPLPPHKDLSHYIHRGDAKSMTHAMMCMHDSGYNNCLDDLLKGVTNEE